MYIDDFIGDKTEIIEKAMKHPGLAPKRNPTIENAMKVVASEVEAAVIQNVQQTVLPLVQDIYEMYTLMNGEYDDAETGGAIAPDEYSSGLDDALEKTLEPYEALLSADWLGRHTIDTRLWEDGAIVKLSQSVGKEVYKQLSYQKTPAQVLSNAGIVQADVEVFFEQHLSDPQPTKRKETMSNDRTLETVAAKIKAHVGDDFDQMSVYDDIELACDDDEILADGAGARLGLDTEDVAVLQFAVLDHDDLPSRVIELVNGADVAKGKSSTKSKGRSKSKADSNEPAPTDAVDAKVLKLMKEHGATKDTDMASRLGVSRATYNNWLNGKTHFQPDTDQYNEVRTELVSNVNGLLEALAALDGTDQMEVS